MNRPTVRWRLLFLVGAVLLDGCRSAQPPERITIPATIAAATVEAESFSGADADYEADVVGPDGLRGTLTIAIEEGTEPAVRKWFDERVQQPLVVARLEAGIKLVLGKERKTGTPPPSIPTTNVEHNLERGTISISPTSGEMTIWLSQRRDTLYGERPIARIRSGIEYLDALEQLVGRDGILTVPIELRFRRR
ncbi:MAG: hypothetical protein KatS3mg040_0108 [Candidatus Kapaibacterium sp.]|nr:MAG: hypothetical protein KatS3mg040_0108 [Candidatus Kapabacteria bacterium]